jgi:hypothetical protein
MLLVLFGTSVALAQDDCPAIVTQALATVNSVCGDTARNQVCYGNILLSATPFENSVEFQFEQSGDLANIADIQRLQLSSMSLADETWGVALMRVQANLPDSLPGQNVTFLLFGDVQIENAVESIVELPMQSTGKVNVRLRPTTNSDNVIASLSTGQEVIATGRLADNSWIRIKLEEDARGVGWVSGDFLNTDGGDTDSLVIVQPDTPQLGPMQAFYFKTGMNDRSCAESPDSGILVQTPEGARRVQLQLNGVDISLGSTVYLQAGEGYMIVSVVEGQATLEVQGQSQFVPAGSFSRVPLDENGVAAGAPEFPQPYDYEALLALPVEVTLPQSVEIAPALTDDEIAAEINKAESAISSGSWTITSILIEQSGPCTGSTSTFSLAAAINPSEDASSITYDNGISYCTDGETLGILPRTGDNTYSKSCTYGSGRNAISITFTSPTTLSGEWSGSGAGGDCPFRYQLSGQFAG